ncbi:MAG: hypothetical protein Fur006_23520 [Coleofasciculaceae cyanobacterium]
MNIPGFTADASLHRSATLYASVIFLEALDAAVLPQAPKVQGAKNGGYGTRIGRYMGCVIGCHDKYPPSADSSGNFNSLYRQGCLDSCQASLDL